MTIAAEKALISASLLNQRNVALAKCSSIHFQDQRLGAIWDQIVKLDSAGEMADPTIIADSLKKHAVDVDFIAKVLEIHGSPELTEKYSESILDSWVERQSRSELSDCLAGQDLSGRDFLDEVLSRLSKIKTPEKTTIIDIRSAAHEALDSIERAYNDKTGYTGIPVGIGGIDESTGGIQKGVITIIGARVSVGKTSLACAISYEVARRGKRVHIYSLEDNADRVAKRLIARNTRINSFNAARGKISADQLFRITVGAGEVANLPIAIYDQHPESASRLCQEIRQHARENLPELIVVDYIQLLGEPSMKVGRVEELTAISRMLKRVAKDIGCGFLLLSQLRRLYSRDRPSLQDLRESGALEQDAHIVILLHRGTKLPVTEAIIAKNKDGPTGTRLLQWDFECSTFWDCPIQLEAEYESIRRRDEETEARRQRTSW